MTKSNHITPNVRFEGITAAHTAVSYRFTEVLRSLDDCIAAERPLQRGVADIFGTSFDTTLAEAEMARESLLANLTAVIATPEERNTDRSLRLVAMALKTLLAIECDEDRIYVFGTLMRHAHLLEAQGRHPAIKAVHRMQRRFFTLLTELMQLEDFGGPGPDDGGAYGPMMAA
jgi:hypothetical protein